MTFPKIFDDDDPGRGDGAGGPHQDGHAGCAGGERDPDRHCGGSRCGWGLGLAAGA